MSVVETLNISNPVTGVPVAASAYVLYEADGRVCAATKHGIKDNKLGLGRIVSLERFGKEIANSKARSKSDLLPWNMLLHGDERMVWHTLATKRPMWFLLQGKSKGFEVWWPALLWDLDRAKRQLRIFALGRNTRPRLSTKVYHAPLMNIDSRGVLCEGSATLPRELSLSTLENIERCVFDSAFTHVNHDQTLSTGKSNSHHVRFWSKKNKSNSRVRVCEMVVYGDLERVLG